MTEQTAFDAAVESVAAGASATDEAAALYAELTDDERLWLLDGDEDIYTGGAAMAAEGYNARPIVHGAVDRLGIPGLRFVDGPRGCVAGNGTAFPTSSARAATWDAALEERIGRAIGAEVRSQGGNFFGGVCINLTRHPAWGRAQESYGDDPYILGEMGAALVRGVQHDAMACVKHYALNSMENARFTVDVTCDDASLHDVYLPHFRRCIEEGAAAVMTAYNSVNGEWCGQNHELMEGVLRDGWGFEGVTVSDFIFGFRDAATSLEAGLDVEEPFRQQRATHLPGALERGEVGWDKVARAGLRILATQLRHHASLTSTAPGPEVMACPDHRALAREAAAKAMVLLRNEPVDGTPVLPIDPGVASIAVVGRLSTRTNMGDLGSSNVRPPSTSTPADGIAEAFPDATVVVVDDDLDAAVAAATAAEVAVVVVGYDETDEGEYLSGDVFSTPEILALFPPVPPAPAVEEQTPTPDDTAPDATEAPAPAPAAGASEDRSDDDPLGLSGGAIGGDRGSLRLRPEEEALIAAVVAANPRTVVAVVASGPVVDQTWHRSVPAHLVMWYAGMEGGRALGDVLSGRVPPSGRLPFSVPTSEEHLPPFDRDATSVVYDRWHGQRLLDRLEVPAAHPLGFGITYTTFEQGEPVVAGVEGTTVQLRVPVRNIGGSPGRQVVQVYGERSTGAYAGESILCGFAVVDLDPGQEADVPVEASLVALAEWDPSERRRLPPATADVRLTIGAHAHDPSAHTIALGAN